MASEEPAEGSGTDERTARTVGQIVKYSREVNQSQTVGQVGSYALEAAVHVLDRHPTPTVVELAADGRRVLESMAPGIDRDGDGGPLVDAALEEDRTVVVAADAVDVALEEEVPVRSPSSFADPPDAAVSIAVPSVQASEDGDVGVVMVVQWPGLDRIESHHVTPVEYLADHVATAIANIRSRERLERARNDLAKRKEMIELYDKLLRHDLGNDLQVVSGFADALVGRLDGENAQYAEKIHRAAENSADLIERVGNLVSTLEAEEEPEPRSLQAVLSTVVTNVDSQYETLDIEFDPDIFNYQVYGGDLLDSVFQNILSNAAVHNEGDITVRMYVEKLPPDMLVVGMADDGSGIPEEIRDELFEMGKKGPESEGTGLGLGFVRALTESYGGGVEVTDSEFGGAEFRVHLERV